MKLFKLFFTKNDCYKKNEKIKPKGIMVHSTGANNPTLKRYVGPDDGRLGKNIWGNHWNTPNLAVCVHAFIGKLKDGTVATYQTLPWDHRGWHAGTGTKGKAASANNTHISFEICEDGLKDSVYFNKVYKEAVELCAYLCKEYNLTEKDIICHSEGCMQGIASNHGDVMHWFPRHGKSMDTFRADVKALLNPTVVNKPKKTPSVVATGVAHGFDKALAGTYMVTEKSGVCIRHSANSAAKRLVAIPWGYKVQCYGYYTSTLGAKWLYVQITYMGVQYTGFMPAKYLKKQ
jgi:hypothetical protein